MQLSGAFACSHSGLIISRADQAPAAERENVFGAFRAMSEAIESLAPDLLVIVGTDHGRIWGFEGVPQFTIGVGATARGIGDADLPACEHAVHQGAARSILDGLLARDFDIAFSEAVRIDHSFVAPLMLALPDTELPVVPIVQNCNVPPLPTLARSHRFGAALGAAIEASGPGNAVLIGTGGLSHWVGSDSFRAFMNRPAGTRIDDRDDNPITLEDTGPVNESFDRDFLDLICSGDAAAFASEWDTARLGETAGNGGQEVRNWLTAAGATSDASATVLGYEPVAAWLTGTGIVRFDI